MVLLAKHLQPQRAPKASVQIVIKRACLGRPLGSTSVESLALGQVLKVTPDEAAQLVLWAGAALFVDSADDDTPDRRNTINPEAQAAIDSESRLLKERDERRAEEAAFERASRRALIEKYGTA